MKIKKYTLSVVVLVGLLVLSIPVKGIYASATLDDPSLRDSVNSDSNVSSQPYVAPALSSPSTSTYVPTTAPTAASNAATSTSSTAPVAPVSSSGLVPCDNSAAKPCNFGSLMTLVFNVINFILFAMAVPIAAIMFAYAGFLYLTAGSESAGARTKANGIFINVVWGLVIAIAAWLIVKTLLSILGWSGAWIGF